MIEVFGVTIDLISVTKSFLRIMFVFICFSGLILLITPSIFGKIAHRLQKKYGLRKEVFPWLEGDRIIVDHFIATHYKVIGILAIVVSLISFVVLS